jgi:putative ABC transport system substrate-binding protein
LRLIVLDVRTPADIETAFPTAFPDQAGALVVGGDAFFSAHRDQIIALAARYRVPTIYSSLSPVAVGGLMSYGTDLNESYRIVGVYTGRILKGDKPADLPVQQVTKIELAINLKTAKALGLTVPQSILVRADQVIE